MDPNVIQSILSGIVSGGGSAATAFAAVFRDIKKRLKTLEDRVGNDAKDGEPKTGLFLALERTTELISRVEETAGRIKREIKDWEEDPPEWLVRVVNRAARSTSVTLEHHSELERLIEQKARTTAASIARLEESIEHLEKQLDGYVTRIDYEHDALEREEAIGKFREHIASVNGLLRGIMTAMGYVDPTKKRPGG